MDPAVAREAYRLFTTAVALITTDGRRGPNVMAAEWTFNVSYDPFLISVHIEPGEATHDMIVESGEFGVNLVGEAQRVAMAFAGHFSHHEVDKLSSELFETYPARQIRAPMLRGCLLNAECRLVQRIPIGDHVAFVGEVLDLSVDASKRPLVLHRGAHRLGETIERPVAIAVAATPMRTRPGSTVTVDGELTAPQRGHQAIAISLLDPEGNERASLTATTDASGYFHAALPIAGEMSSGQGRLVATFRDAVGRARVVVESVSGS